ncbi:hypothetical protein LTR72_004958 [Exophiala xenobiotica]|nr:hypothetical protein LTR72_004958 [Exophiala xenobiotica]KAK5286342.1 hypothetical protein LTR14_010010 [Exophiala xenobiotica]KAK5499867.1 hypothetical protein LTR55_000690 [Exophiala xenobiotica]
MGRRPARPELVDLLTDSDEESPRQHSTSSSQVQNKALQAERSYDHVKTHNWLLAPLPTYTKGRVHLFTDLKTGVKKEHYIPDDQLKCPECGIELFEREADTKEVTDKELNTRSLRPGADSNVQASNTDAQGVDRKGSALLGADGSAAAATASDKGKRNDRDRRPRVFDIIEDDDSTTSHTEAGSGGEENQIFPGPSQQIPSQLRSQRDRGLVRKGTQRELITEIDLSQLSDDDDAQSSLSRSGRAISLIGDANELDDEDYRRAVALSLQDATVLDAGKSTPSGNSSNSNDGSEDEDLRRAIAMSLKDAENKQGKEMVLPVEDSVPSNGLPTANPHAAPLAASLPTAPHTQPSGTTSSSAFSIFGLNRKQMEEERLARLKRKHAGENDNADGQLSKALRLDVSGSSTRISPPPLQRQIRQLTTAVPSSAGASRQQPTPRQQHPNASPTLLPLYYPRGKVFKTALSNSDTDTNTISFPSLLGPTTALESVLLSSFIWDFDWLFPHFDTKSTKFQLVMHAKSVGQRDAIKSDFQGVNNVRICFPPMDGLVNCMHSKLMLLFYKKAPDGDGDGDGWSQRTRCRLVIPTANLVGFDWGVGSFMENSVFLLDLPGKGNPRESTASIMGTAQGTETEFETSLSAFLTAQTVPADVLVKLSGFDFSQTKHLGFVHTIGGAHTGPTRTTTGHYGLSRTITHLGLATQRPIEMDYVTSSLGNLNDGFMTSMYRAAQGDLSSSSDSPPWPCAAKKTSSASRHINQAEDRRQEQEQREWWKNNFRIYYPSDQTVRQSKGGPRNAGTICFSNKWWAQGTFPRSNMRDCISSREGMLMHNKLLYVRPACASGSDANDASDSQRSWVYVGSANLSESAWGKLVQDKSTRRPKLNCRNWECGVVIPVATTTTDGEVVDNKGKHGSGVTRTDLAVFEKIVPIPMKFPGESLVEKGRKPWTLFD